LKASILEGQKMETINLRTTDDTLSLMKHWKGNELSSVRFDDAVWGNATELIFEDGSIFSIIGVEPRKGSFSERAESFSDDFRSFVVAPSKPNRDAKNSVDISKKIQRIEILSLKSMNRSLDLCVDADLALVLFFDDGSSISFLAANTISDGINFYPDGPIPQKDFPDGYFLDFSGEGFLVDEERMDI
jgi:hypothetical protein